MGGYGKQCTPRRLWLNHVAMWLDNFSMRNFTNASVFDDTLPVADGLMEIGKKVPLDQLKAAMEDWFRRKMYLSRTAKLIVAEQQRS